MSESQRERLTPPEAPVQCQAEEAGRIRVRVAHRRSVRTLNLNVRDGQLLLRVGVRAQDCPFNGYWSHLANGDKYPCHNTGESCNRKNPDRNLSSPTHAFPII